MMNQRTTRRSRLGMTGIGLIAWAMLSSVAQAQTSQSSGGSTTLNFIPELPFPGFSSSPADSSLLAHYIRALFVYFIWVVGILAVFMIIYAGVKWISAAGNPGRIKDARETLNNAVIGVIIALTSFLLLNIINPKLTQLNVPGLNQVQTAQLNGLAITQVCDFDLKVQCGQIIETGTTTGVDAKTGKPTQVKAYCAGVVCSSGIKFGFKYGSPQICQLQTDPNTKYIVPGHCVSNITIQPPLSANNVSYSVIPVSNSIFKEFQNLIICGVVGRDFTNLTGNPFFVGYSCPSGKEDQSQCYLMGQTGTVGKILSLNNIKNMRCPPTSSS